MAAYNWSASLPVVEGDGVVYLSGPSPSFVAAGVVDSPASAVMPAVGRRSRRSRRSRRGGRDNHNRRSLWRE